MKLSVHFTPAGLVAGALSGRPVVVVDVLRATTTIVTALFNGAKAVLPAATGDDALKLAQNLQRGDVLLAGERRSERIPGFALGNSPLEMVPEVVHRKTLVMTTTNGIPAILAASEARPVFIGAAANFQAVATAARRAFEEAGELAILCAGRERGFALEDAYAAGRLVEAIVPGSARRRLDTNDAVIAARELVKKFGRAWKTAVTASAHARFLKERGFARDLVFCAQEDTHPVVPIYADRRITVPERG